jgi:hypothetical protein
VPPDAWGHPWVLLNGTPAGCPDDDQHDGPGGDQEPENEQRHRERQQEPGLDLDCPGDLDDAVARDQHILGFHVAMHEPCGVRRAERRE